MRRILILATALANSDTERNRVMKTLLTLTIVLLALSTIPDLAEAQFGVLKSRPVVWDVVVDPGKHVSKTVTVWDAVEGDFCLANHNGIVEAWPVQVTCNVYKANSVRVTITNLSVGDGSALVLNGKVRVMVLH